MCIEHGTVVVEQAPAIPGLHFRHVDDERDAVALFRVHEECMEHDRVDRLSSIEHTPTQQGIARRLRDAQQQGCTANWLVAQIDEEVIGYSRIEWWTETDDLWVYLTLGWVTPQWRGRGIGGAMLHWAESRIQVLASKHPTHGRWEYASNATNTEIEATALLQENGYYAAYTVLDMELTDFSRVPEPHLPPGLELRPLTPEHYRAVWDSIQASYEKGRYSEDPTEERFRAYFDSSKHDPALWQVAWDGGEVAGQVLCRIERGRGEAYEVSVRPQWRRRGVARGLLAFGLRALQQRGIATVRLHTVAEFPTQAKNLYGSVGFHVRKAFPRYRKPQEAENR
jgi:mycothiol synthase